MASPCRATELLHLPHKAAGVVLLPKIRDGQAKDNADAAPTAVADNKESWGLLFWIVLMTGAADEGIIGRWVDLVKYKVPEQLRESVVTVALAFAELAGRFLAWEHVLGGMLMGGSIIGDRLRSQGEVRNKQAWLLELLRAKYPGSVSDEVVQLVKRQNDPLLLQTWFTSALQTGTFEEFVRTLK